MSDDLKVRLRQLHEKKQRIAVHAAGKVIGTGIITNIGDSFFELTGTANEQLLVAFDAFTHLDLNPS